MQFPITQRGCGGRILLHRERSPDLGDDLFRSATYFDHNCFLGLFEIRQLARENRFSGEVSVTRTQAIRN
jgi:hypothetical protein